MTFFFLFIIHVIWSLVRLQYFLSYLFHIDHFILPIWRSLFFFTLPFYHESSIFFYYKNLISPILHLFLLPFVPFFANLWFLSVKCLTCEPAWSLPCWHDFQADQKDYTQSLIIFILFHCICFFSQFSHQEIKSFTPNPTIQPHFALLLWSAFSNPLIQILLTSST